MEDMVYGIATRGWEGAAECIETWHSTASKRYPEFYAKDMDILPALQYIYENTTEPIIAYIHDDVKILEPNWDLRVLKEFEDLTVGMVGFGAATRHGTPDLYTSPYKLSNLARFGFASNMRDWQQHGAYFDGVRDCAVYDGFAVFIRRSILDKIGGWRKRAGYYMYMESVCCEARIQGFRLRQVGIKCDHLSGKTSSMAHIAESHADVHRWFWHKYRVCLPFAVGGA